MGDISQYDARIISSPHNATVDLAIELMGIMHANMENSHKPCIGVIGSSKETWKLLKFVKSLGYRLKLFYSESSIEGNIAKEMTKDYESCSSLFGSPAPALPTSGSVNENESSAEKISSPPKASKKKKKSKGKMHIDDISVFLPILRSIFDLSVKNKCGFHGSSRIRESLTVDIKQLGFTKMKFLAEELKKHELVKISSPSNTNSLELGLSIEGYCFLIQSELAAKKLDYQSDLISKENAFHPLILSIFYLNEKFKDASMERLSGILKPFLGPFFDRYLRKSIKKGIVNINGDISSSKSLIKIA